MLVIESLAAMENVSDAQETSLERSLSGFIPRIQRKKSSKKNFETFWLITLSFLEQLFLQA